MDYKTVKELFVTATGRMDLDNESPIGAAYFINAGQRWLDSRLDFPKAQSRHFVGVEAGQLSVVFKGCRSLLEVWYTDSAATRTHLKRLGWTAFREKYGSFFETVPADLTFSGRTLAATDTGTPEHYAPLIVSPSPDQNGWLTPSPQGLADTEGLLRGEHWNYGGIMLGPPPDAGGTVTLVGNFFSPELRADADKSYWTEVHPDLLVMAAAYKLETHYRNFEGMRDWLAALNDGLAGLDRDSIAQESTGVKAFGG